MIESGLLKQQKLTFIFLIYLLYIEKLTFIVWFDEQLFIKSSLHTLALFIHFPENMNDDTESSLSLMVSGWVKPFIIKKKLTMD